MSDLQFGYVFEPGKAEGNAGMKELLGGKGANLAEMCNLGLSVPPGLTIDTKTCVDYMKCATEAGRELLVSSCVNYTMSVLKGDLGHETKYGPGLYSVRSGARVSMPGMMDTVLNVGITLDNLSMWCEKLGKRTALDCFRRLIQMYGEVVCHIPSEMFKNQLKSVLLDMKAKHESELGEGGMELLAGRYNMMYENLTGCPFPLTIEEQLAGCIEAVWQSWNSERAVAYRKANNIPNDWGTAVNVQRMVFGNMNDKSATGVLFTRNPKTGKNGLYGEYLVNAQGEDVVAGIKTPMELHNMAAWNVDVYASLVKTASGMEKHYKDMQDMEFTVEDGKLWILQTRTGKRSAQAAFRIAYEMVEEGLIDKATALKRVSAKQYAVLTKPQIDPEFKVKPLHTGIPASNGIVSGKVARTKEEAISTPGCILVRQETSPADYPGMLKAVGILTTTGGSTSHAAVVARGMDKPCVVGCTDLDLNKLTGDDVVTLDGATGRVWVNVEVPVVQLKTEQHVRELLKWALEGKTYTLAVAPKFGKDAVGLLSGQEDLIPQEGLVVVKTEGIQNDNSYAQTDLAIMLKSLKARAKLRGVIDLTRKTATHEDGKYLYFLGVDGELEMDNKKQLGNLLKALAQKQWTTTFKQSWVLNLPDSVSEPIRAEVRSWGWKLVSRVSTIAELMQADGMVEIDPKFKTWAADNNVKMEELLGIWKLAGRKLDPLPSAVAKEVLVLSALGG